MGDRISGWNNYDFKISSVVPWNSSVHFESLKGEISLKVNKEIGDILTNMHV